MSVPPPAANGMTQRIGLLGYAPLCANECAVAMSASRIAMAMRRGMSVGTRSSELHDLRPQRDLRAVEAIELVRRRRGELGAEGGDALFHFRSAEAANDLRIELADDIARRRR